jgi:hypothetical protein
MLNFDSTKINRGKVVVLPTFVSRIVNRKRSSSITSTGEFRLAWKHFQAGLSKLFRPDK